MAKSIRLDEQTLEQLRNISRAEGRPVGRVLEDAIRQYERKRFWDGVCDDYQRLRSNPDAWSDYQREIELLEGSLMDGLASEDPYYTVEEENEIRAQM